MCYLWLDSICTHVKCEIMDAYTWAKYVDTLMWRWPTKTATFDFFMRAILEVKCCNFNGTVVFSWNKVSAIHLWGRFVYFQNQNECKFSGNKKFILQIQDMQINRCVLTGRGERKLGSRTPSCLDYLNQTMPLLVYLVF